MSSRFVPALILLTAAPAGAQEPATEWRVSEAERRAALDAPLFLSDEVLEFTLRADFGTIRGEDRDPDQESPLRAATLSLAGTEPSVVLDLELQTRGEFRLRPSNCRFPPLWLDFDGDDPALVGTPFEGQNRIKLYPTCQPGRDDYEQYILHEYLLYDLYGLVSDAGYRARLVRVTYEDESGDHEPFTRYGFLLEDVDAVAARFGGVEVELESIHPGWLDQERAAVMELFAFMIGLTDFSIVYSHNSRVVRTGDGVMIPLPYDFDVSGIVDARYARPDERLGTRSVRERVYRGFCRPAVDFPALYRRFLGQRSAIRELYDGFELLDRGTREDALDYLDGFFRIVEDEGRARRYVIDRCRDMPG